MNKKQWMILGRVLAVIGVVGALAQPAQAADPQPFKGYACCTLHYEKDWISDGNYAGLPSYPPGTPISVLSFGRHKANADVKGVKMRLGHDYGRDQETLEQWLHKIVVDTDPTVKLATYPRDVQEAIRHGRVTGGMTKEQAIMAVGYPLTSENASLDAPIWRHWVSSFEEYQLVWGPDGRIKEISAPETVKNQIVYMPSGSP
jgi:hypothetical protein